MQTIFPNPTPSTDLTAQSTDAPAASAKDASACCSTTESASCCAPSEKSSCCGTPDPTVTPATRCGCR